MGIAALVFLVVVIIGYVMPWLGADLLGMARDVAAFVPLHGMSAADWQRVFNGAGCGRRRLPPRGDPAGARSSAKPTAGAWSLGGSARDRGDKLDLGVIVKATVEQFATWLKKAPPIEPFLAWALLEGEVRQRFGEVSLALAISHLLEHADRDTLRQVLGHLVTKLDAETIALSVAAGRNMREEELQNRRATIRLVSDGTESAKPARSTPDLTVR